MDTLATPAERARKAYARVLQSIQEPGSQVALARAMGRSESTISRLKNDALPSCLELLCYCGFDLVPEDAQPIDRSTVDFMRRVTAWVMSKPVVAQQMFQEIDR